MKSKWFKIEATMSAVNAFFEKSPEQIERRVVSGNTFGIEPLKI